MAFYLKKNVDWLPRLHFHYFKRKIRWNFCWVKKKYKNELNKKFNVSNVYACMKSLNTVFPHIVSSLEQFPHIYVLWPLALCTVTFGFPNPKMRKYGTCLNIMSILPCLVIMIATYSNFNSFVTWQLSAP